MEILLSDSVELAKRYIYMTEYYYEKLQDRRDEVMSTTPPEELTQRVRVGRKTEIKAIRLLVDGKYNFLKKMLDAALKYINSLSYYQKYVIKQYRADNLHTQQDKNELGNIVRELSEIFQEIRVNYIDTDALRWYKEDEV